MHGLHLGQEVAEFAVVHFDAVIEVELDAFVREVAELFVKGQKFEVLLFEFGLLFLQTLLVRRGRGGSDVARKLLHAVGHFTLEGDDVFAAHA